MSNITENAAGVNSIYRADHETTTGDDDQSQYFRGQKIVRIEPVEGGRTTEQFLAASRAAAVEEMGLPGIVSASALVKSKIPPPPELIKGILHQGSKMVIAGGSKSFKTWCLIDLALSVSAGKQWWGVDTTQGRVLYINFEIQDFFFSNRIETVAGAKYISVQEMDTLDVWNLRGYAADFKLLQDEISNRAGLKYVLIIIDPVYKGLGDRDENKAGDIARLLNEFDKLATTTKAAVIFGAHFSKGNQANKEPMDRIGGSGVFARDPDSIIILTKHEEVDAFTVEPTLRNLKPIQPFCIKWKYPLMERAHSLDPAKLKSSNKKQRQFTEEMMLKVLSIQSLTTGDWLKQAKQSTGVGERTFMNLIKSLKNRADIEKDEKTQEWTVVKLPEVQ